MDDKLRARLEHLELMSVFKFGDEFIVAQFNPETGAVGVVPGPDFKTCRQAERYRYIWAGFDLEDEDFDDLDDRSCPDFSEFLAALENAREENRDRSGVPGGRSRIA